MATIGNNEGMTISHEALNHLYDDANFKVTCSNVIDESGHLPNNIVSSYIKEIADTKFYSSQQQHHLHHFTEHLIGLLLTL